MNTIHQQFCKRHPADKFTRGSGVQLRSLGKLFNKELPQIMAVDMELKKAFQELQSKMIATQQQLKISDMQIDTHKRQIAHAKLVDGELSHIPDGTRTYEGIGRMFVLQPISTIKLGLSEKLKQADEKIKTIETNKTYLEKSMKESEDNLREMVMSRQSQK